MKKIVLIKGCNGKDATTFPSALAIAGSKEMAFVSGTTLRSEIHSMLGITSDMETLEEMKDQVEGLKFFALIEEVEQTMTAKKELAAVDEQNNPILSGVKNKTGVDLFILKTPTKSLNTIEVAASIELMVELCQDIDVIDNFVARDKARKIAAAEINSESFNKARSINEAAVKALLATRTTTTAKVETAKVEAPFEVEEKTLTMDNTGD